MRYALAAALLAFVATPAISAPSVKQMIEAWNKAGETCSGSGSDEQIRSDECARTEALRAHLNDAGWCYGKQDQAIYQRQWHRCEATSILPNDLRPATTR